MQPWDETSNKVTKISKDIEKAKALLKMTELLQERTKSTTLPKFTSLLLTDYYEIIKELITGIMGADGWKTVSHELLVGYLKKFYSEFTASEIALIDQLRAVRNDIAYRGTMINPEYLERNQKEIIVIITKLKQTLNKKISK